MDLGASRASRCRGRSQDASNSSRFLAVKSRLRAVREGMVAEGEELQTNLLQVSQRGPASSSVLDEVFGTHSSKIFPTHVLRTTGTTPPVQRTPGGPAQPDGPTLHQRCAAPLRRRTARPGRITLAGLESVICLYPEYSPGHGTHPRPDSAVVIAGPDQAHIAIAGSDDLAYVVMMA